MRNLVLTMLSFLRARIIAKPVRGSKGVSEVLVRAALPRVVGLGEVFLPISFSRLRLYYNYGDQSGR